MLGLFNMLCPDDSITAKVIHMFAVDSYSLKKTLEFYEIVDFPDDLSAKIVEVAQSWSNCNFENIDDVIQNAVEASYIRCDDIVRRFIEDLPKKDGGCILLGFGQAIAVGPITHKSLAFLFISEIVSRDIFSELGILDVSDQIISAIDNICVAWREKSRKNMKSVTMMKSTSYLEARKVDVVPILDPIENNLNKDKTPKRFSVPPVPIGAARKIRKSVGPSQEKEEAAKMAMQNKVFEIVMKFPKSSNLYSELQTGDPEVVANMVCEAISRRDPGGLQTKILFWEWLQTESEKCGVSPFDLKPMHILELWRVKRGSSMMQATCFIRLLNWCKNNFGVPLEVPQVMKQSMVSSQVKFAPRKGEAKSREISELLHLEKLVGSHISSSVRFYASCVLALCWVSLRLVDSKRLRFAPWRDSQDKAYFEGNLFSHNNPRLVGQQVPIPVACPKTGIFNHEWWIPLQMFSSDRDFLIPTCKGVITDALVTFDWSKRAESVEIRNNVALLFKIKTKYNDPCTNACANLKENAPPKGHKFRFYCRTLGDLCNLPEPRARLLGRWKIVKSRDGTQSQSYSSERVRATVQVIMSLQLVILKSINSISFLSRVISFDDISPYHFQYLSVSGFATELTGKDNAFKQNSESCASSAIACDNTDKSVESSSKVTPVCDSTNKDGESSSKVAPKKAGRPRKNTHNNPIPTPCVSTSLLPIAKGVSTSSRTMLSDVRKVNPTDHSEGDDTVCIPPEVEGDVEVFVEPRSSDSDPDYDPLTDSEYYSD